MVPALDEAGTMYLSINVKTIEESALGNLHLLVLGSAPSNCKEARGDGAKDHDGRIVGAKVEAEAMDRQVGDGANAHAVVQRNPGSLTEDITLTVEQPHRCRSCHNIVDGDRVPTGATCSLGG